MIDYQYSAMAQPLPLSKLVPDMSTPEFGIDLANGLLHTTVGVSNSLPTFEGGGWELFSHSVGEVGGHLVVTYLLRRPR